MDPLLKMLLEKMDRDLEAQKSFTEKGFITLNEKVDRLLQVKWRFEGGKDDSASGARSLVTSTSRYHLSVVAVGP